MPRHGPPRQPHRNWLRDDLWPPNGPLRRSRELTPTKVNRYYGPRHHCWSDLHDFWELGAVLAGEGELFCETGDAIRLQPGCVFLIPPRAAHGENAHDQVDIVFVGLRGQWLGSDGEQAIRHVENPSLARQIEEFWLLSLRPAEYSAGARLDGLARIIVSEFMRCLAAPEPDHDTGKIETATQLMRQRLAENIPVPELARLLGYSTDYFRRVFRHRMNMTPTGYLIGLRMQQAVQMLEYSDLTVGQIALQCGFHDPLYFSRMFHRKMGCSPMQYRRKYRIRS